MRRVVFATVAVALLSFPAAAYLAQRASVDTWNAAALGTAPPVSATKAFVRNITTGENYYDKNADTVTAANDAASLAKLATATVVVRELQYGVITLTSTTTVLTGEPVAGTTCSLQVNDVISVKDLLYCLLLPSGNDSAEVLARYIGTVIRTRTGSGNTGRVRFIEEMNALATEIGASSTTFESPHGVEYAPGGSATAENFTTARDLARFLKRAYYDADTQALSSPSLQTIASTAGYTVTITGVNARTYGISHTSQLVTPSADFGIVAVKTGSSSDGDYNIAALWQTPSGDYIETIVISSPTTGDRYADVRGMYYEAESDWPTIAGSVGTDSLFSSVILLSGADPGFTDESSYARTLTNVGITRTTTNPLVGTHSYSGVAASSQYIWSADSAELDIGASDLCVEAWLRGAGTEALSASSTGGAIVGQYNVASARSWLLQYYPLDNTFHFYASANGSTFVEGAFLLSDTGYSPDVFFNGAPHYVAACRQGGFLYVWVDGVRGSTSQAFSSNYFNTTALLQEFARIQTGTTPENFFGGYLDELRVTKASRFSGSPAKIPVILKAFPRTGP